MNRRNFLALLAGGAGIVAAAPVRRIWAVGATLERRGIVHVDPRFAKMQTEITAEDIRRWAETLRAQNNYNPTGMDDGDYIRIPLTGNQTITGLDDQLADAVSAGYLICDDVLDTSPIVVRTEIVEGCRS